MPVVAKNLSRGRDGGGTYAAERDIAEKALREAGVREEDIQDALSAFNPDVKGKKIDLSKTYTDTFVNAAK